MSFQQQAKRSTRQVTSGKKTGRSASVNVSDAPKAPMPHNVRPMLASPVEQPFDHADWLFEVKWDGYRAIAEIEDGRVRLYSRNMLPFEQRYSPIVSSLVNQSHKRNFKWNRALLIYALYAFLRHAYCDKSVQSSGRPC